MIKATSGSQGESDWCATLGPHSFGPLCPFFALPGAIWSDPCTLGKDSNPHPQKLPPPSCMQPSFWPYLVNWHDPQVGENSRMKKQVISSEHWLHVFLRWYCAQMTNMSRRIRPGNYIFTWAGKVRDETMLHHWWGPYHLLKTYPNGSRESVEIDTFLKLLQSSFPRQNQRVRIISFSMSYHISALDLIINS